MMDDEIERQCGMCRWWTVPAFGRVRGECDAPLPWSLEDWTRGTTRAVDGTDCPTWSRKDD